MLTTFAICASAFAQTPSSAPSSQPTGEAGFKTTDHQFDNGITQFPYRATAGLLPLTDDAGKARAQMFCVAYLRSDLPKSSPRPLTFVFNGGPGAAAVWLHLGAVGPMRVAMDDFGHVGGPPFKLVPNTDSWLDATDLVFIDPVGTGYSRPAEGVKMSDFTGTKNDLDSVAAFIRLYLTRENRWGSPIYLAGESYGTIRAAALSDLLADRDGIAVSGIVLMSTVLNLQTLDFHPGNDLGYALYMPSFATVAWFHHKLSPQLQALSVEQVAERARAWMQDRYVPALAKGAMLAEADRRAIAGEFATWTGLSADDVFAANLRISGPQFEKILLKQNRQILGRFDARMTGFDIAPLAENPNFDPSLSEYLPAYTSTFNDYVRGTLNYSNDVKYEVLSPLVHPWDFGQGILNVSEDLVSHMVQHPYTKVLICSGYFDLATPFAAIDQTISGFDLPPAIRKQIQTRYFTGGHMMYHSASDRRKLHEVVVEMLAKPPATQPQP